MSDAPTPTSTIGQKVGMLVRGDATGLGELSRTFYKYIRPDRVLCVAPARPWRHDFDIYDTAIPPEIVSSPIPHPDIYSFLDGLDVVFSCETFYEPQFVDIARKKGVRTVLMPMPEYSPWIAAPRTPAPDLFILPTPWMKEKFDAHHFRTVVIPPPIDTDIFSPTQRNSASTFLHTVGRFSRLDRAGTRLIFDALPHIKSKIGLTIRSQGPVNLPSGRYGRSRNVTVTVRANTNMPTSRALYEPSLDVLVAPRRYAGLSLPIWEATGLGMPVIALNRSPESDLLPRESLVPAHISTYIDLPAGMVDVYTCNPVDLAATIDILANDPDLVANLSLHSITLAKSHSWPMLEEKYFKAFFPRRDYGLEIKPVSHEFITAE